MSSNKVYAIAAELRTQIDKTGTTGAASDTALAVILAGVSESIDRLLNHPDGFYADSIATARLYAGSGGIWQRIDECAAITAVAVKDSVTDSSYTSWSSSDYIPCSGDPKDPDFNSLPYTALMIDPNGDYSHFTGGKYAGTPGFKPIESTWRSVPTVRVTARWGYQLQTPPLIKQACIAIAASWFKQGEGGWAGDALASTDFGQLIYNAENSMVRKMLENSRLYRPAVGRR